MQVSKILFLSSWSMFNEREEITLPFVHEQIEALSELSTSYFAFFQFLPFSQWLNFYFANNWINAISSPFQNGQKNKVTCYKILLPKLSTRLTNNEVWEDFFWASRLLGKKIVDQIGDIDIVHVHTILPQGAMALGLFKSTGIPYVIQEHSGPFKMHVKSPSSLKGIEKISKSAKAILPVSRSLRGEMKKYCGKDSNFIVAPNWVRTDIFYPCKIVEPNGSSEEIKIISVCSSQKVKRHWLMFSTVANLIKRGFSATLDLYGIPNKHPDLSQEVKKYGVSNFVKFHGRVSRDELKKIYCQYDVYLCTSEVETFGLAPAEAICSGVPVVSTNCGGVEEFVTNKNGKIVKNDTAEELTDAILSMKQHRVSSKEWNRMDQKYGKKAFQNFFLQVYQKV